MKIGAFQINPLVGNLSGNTDKIIKALKRAKSQGVEIALFPELAISGYPPEDLLFFKSFISEIENSLKKIVKASKGLFVVVGTIRQEKGALFNSAAVIANGKLLGYKDKTLLPDYDVFNESRYFQEGREAGIWKYKNQKIGVLICEDAAAYDIKEELEKNKRYFQTKTKNKKDKGWEIYNRTNPVLELQKLKPDLVLVLSASPYYLNKKVLRLNVHKKIVKTLKCPLLYCNQVGGNDALVFDGQSFCLDRKGELLGWGTGFVENDLIVDTEKQTESKNKNNSQIKNKISQLKLSKTEEIEDLYQALVLGVRDYFFKQGLSRAIIGVSGGIDSAVTACIATEALGKDNILLVSMPSRFSALEGIEDAELLAHNLKIELQELPIDGLFQNFLDYLSPFFYGLKPSTAEENLQARIRGMLLMAISNKRGYVVLSTGNKSEIAMGYVTLYGDMCGGLGVLSDVSKTLVYKLAKYINRSKTIIPKGTITRPPSAELRDNQKDQDDLPQYSVVDMVLKEYVEEHKSFEEIVKRHKIDKQLLKRMIKRIHLAEYKRRQAPPGIIVTKKAFGKGRNFPIVQGWV